MQTDPVFGPYEVHRAPNSARARLKSSPREGADRPSQPTVFLPMGFTRTTYSVTPGFMHQCLQDRNLRERLECFFQKLLIHEVRHEWGAIDSVAALVEQHDVSCVQHDFHRLLELF